MTSSDEGDHAVVSSHRIEVTLLGPVTVTVGHRPVGLGRQQQLLAASLFLEAGKWVPSDRLIARIWDEAPENARERIYDLIRNLRDALDAANPGIGRTVVRQRGGMYMAAVSPDRVDALRLRARLRDAQEANRQEDLRRAAEQYEEAVAQRSGTDLLQPDEPLAGLPGRRAEDMRRSLLTAYQAALFGRLEVGLRLGEHKLLLPTLGEVVAAYPHEERAAEIFMIALYHSRQQADALAEYRRLREELIKEFGAEPSNRLQQLHQRILNQDPGLDLPDTEQPSDTATPHADRAGTSGADTDPGAGSETAAPPWPLQPTSRNVTKVRKVVGGSGPMAIGSGACTNWF
ncbi:MAG TPA: BTAD domain-containing putative transcriptional regulator [Mycobacteriales bacterium]|nr:BTAD domain-containing putative transcriptional regulator [Mycobacteriales bacterium]